MRRRRHIVHVVHRLDVGGLENGVVNLVNHIAPERYRQTIVTLAGFNPEFRQRIKRDDVEVISIDKRPGKDLRAYWRMYRVLRKLRADLVHTRNIGTVDMQWVALAAGVGKRVHGEHGWDASDPNGTNPKGLWIRRACRPAVHRYVPMSQDLARWLRLSVGVSNDRIHQIYNGVDIERFKPRPVDATRSGTVVGSVGRLDPIKNYGALIRAFARLAPDRSNLRLVLVGEGPARDELLRLADSLGVGGVVSLPGKTDNVPDIMRSFDIFVMPSLNEGISNTILEAMASGLPVVAGSVGGNAELVQQGITGVLYPVDNSKGLESALAAYLDDTASIAAHGRAGRERVVQNFSLQGMMQRYVDLYDALLDGT